MVEGIALPPLAALVLLKSGLRESATLSQTQAALEVVQQGPEGAHLPHHLMHTCGAGVVVGLSSHHRSSYKSTVPGSHANYNLNKAGQCRIESCDGDTVGRPSDMTGGVVSKGVHQLPGQYDRGREKVAYLLAMNAEALSRPPTKTSLRRPSIRRLP